MYGLQGFFFENCTDCTDFFLNVRIFFKKVLVTLDIASKMFDSTNKMFILRTNVLYYKQNVKNFSEIFRQYDAEDWKRNPGKLYWRYYCASHSYKEPPIEM